MKRNFLGNKKYRIYLLSFLLFSFAGMLPSLSFADFTDVGASAGVNDSGGGRGITFGDYDNDGDLDIYLSNHDSENNRLYRNNGDGTFTDVAASAGVNDTGDGRGVAFGDYDNDSDLDIYLANFGANRLYRNNGDGTFTDVAASAGVADTGYGVGVALFALGQNIPNPFNPETWIPYELGKAAHVTIQIYDMTGRLVRTLVLGYQTAGTYRKPSRGAYWDGRNDAGERVASGIYFYTLKAGDFKATRRMLIVK